MTDQRALPVNEIFETVQGEAAWTGTPSVFIRLQGCAVGCPWCDTKHTWSLDRADEIPVGKMVTKSADAPTFANMTAHELVDRVRHLFDAGHVVITGGEPCDYDLRTLTGDLERAGCSVQVETSGTSPVRVSSGTWVTVSPKIGMPGGKAVRMDALDRASEIKMPVGKQADIERLDALLEQHGPFLELPQIWLQPLSQSLKATALCVRAATKRGWRVSVQVHKFLGVR